MGTVIALLLVAALSMTAFASEMTGPDEVIEGSDVQVEFTSPEGGGLEGNVNASDNLAFQGISGDNMGASLSDEHHVFSLFGDPVQYTYNVSASAGEEVWVSLTDAEESDENSNLTQLEDMEWRKEVQAAQPTSNPTGQPTSNPTGQPTSNPTGQPTQNPSQIPTLSPSGEPTLSPTTPVIPTNPSTPNTPSGGNGPIRYPAGYAPRPAAQRTIYRSNDGMPKTGDATTATSYWALLSVAALLGVIVIVAATQVCSYGERRQAPATASSSHRHYKR